MRDADPGQMAVAEQLFGMRKVRVYFHLADGRMFEGEVNHFSMQTGKQTTMGIGPLTLTGQTTVFKKE